MPKRTPVANRIDVVDDASAAFWRRKSPAEKIGVCFLLNSMMRKVVAGHLLTMHPHWAPERVDREVALRMLERAIRTEG